MTRPFITGMPTGTSTTRPRRPRRRPTPPRPAGPPSPGSRSSRAACPCRGCRPATPTASSRATASRSCPTGASGRSPAKTPGMGVHKSSLSDMKFVWGRISSYLTAFATKFWTNLPKTGLKFDPKPTNEPSTASSRTACSSPGRSTASWWQQ